MLNLTPIDYLKMGLSFIELNNQKNSIRLLILLRIYAINLLN